MPNNPIEFMKKYMSCPSDVLMETMERENEELQRDVRKLTKEYKEVS